MQGDDDRSRSRPHAARHLTLCYKRCIGLINQMVIHNAFPPARAVVISGDKMKKPFMVICAGAMLALLAGCSSNYVMTTKSGQTIVTRQAAAG
jgi:hypothetical protein